MTEAEAMEVISALVRVCHGNSYRAGWWHDPVTGESLIPEHVNGAANEIRESYAPYVIATKICLIHSEVSEAMEGHRRGAMDDKLPHRSMIEVELADALIRICDLAGQMKLDLAGAVFEKIGYNLERPDHQIVNRRAAGGKLY